MIQGLEKAAEVSDTLQLQQQQYMPIIRERRNLTPQEEAEAESEGSKLIPRIFKSKADSPFVDMATPWGRAGLYGAAGAGMGGLMGLGMAKGKSDAGLAGILGALLLGLPAGAIGYLSRRAENESIKENMRNLPLGATRRTLEADPVYQKERDRENELLAAMTQATGRMHRMGRW